MDVPFATDPTIPTDPTIVGEPWSEGAAPARQQPGDARRRRHRTGRPIGRRAALGVGVLLLTAGIALVAGRVGDDSGRADQGNDGGGQAVDTTTGAERPGSTGSTATDGPSGRADQLVDVLAGELERRGVDAGRAECLARGVVDGVGVGRLGRPGRDGGLPEVTGRSLESMVAAVTGCGADGSTPPSDG
ncbi:MAG TPA: hypothetical protein VFW63_10850 [Acidimicrobiales bacterium]|nr:hypothetical protein [Acidimicrobiales bacterium]